LQFLTTANQFLNQNFKTCWDNNDDGAGMLYIQDGVLVAEKFPNEGHQSADNFAKFYERYNAVKSSESGDLPMLVHFRIATHGATPEYLHPFFVSDTLGLIHNGIIHGFGSAEFQ
jgi:predicted glutamine amidotransferase